jgi:hypothetical protein
MPGSPRSPKLSKTQKLRNLTSTLAIVEEETSPKGRNKIQLPKLNLSTLTSSDDHNIQRHGELEPIIKRSRSPGNSRSAELLTPGNSRSAELLTPGIPKRDEMLTSGIPRSAELSIMKMTLDKCDPDNIYELLKKFINKSSTMEDIEYATSKFAYIKPSINDRKIARIEQLIRVKTKNVKSPDKGGGFTRKLNRRRTSLNFRK